MNLRQRCAILGLLSCALLSGCALYESIDDIEFQPTDSGDMTTADMTTDMTSSDMRVDMPDSPVDSPPDLPEDMTSDLTDMSMVSDMTDMSDLADMSPDMFIPSGQVCPGDPGMITGLCDPVRQDCPANSFCAVNFQLVNGMPQFDLRCFGIDGDETQAEGEPCGAVGGCIAGLTCVTQVCRRMCQRADGLGCGMDQFCREFSGVPAIGYCADACP